MLELTTVAGVVVASSGLYLMGLAFTSILLPVRTKRFLKAFASSAPAHYTEQVMRLIAGGALVVYGREMRFPRVFTAFGWLLVLTAGLLLLVPWRCHQRFGEWAIPLATRRLKLFALGAAGLGAMILYAVLASSP